MGAGTQSFVPIQIPFSIQILFQFELKKSDSYAQESAENGQRATLRESSREADCTELQKDLWKTGNMPPYGNPPWQRIYLNLQESAENGQHATLRESSREADFT